MPPTSNEDSNIAMNQQRRQQKEQRRRQQQQQQTEEDRIRQDERSKIYHHLIEKGVDSKAAKAILPSTQRPTPAPAQIQRKEELIQALYKKRGRIERLKTEIATQKKSIVDLQKKAGEIENTMKEESKAEEALLDELKIVL